MPQGIGWLENWITAYRKVMQKLLEMGDETHDRLGIKIEELKKTVESTTGDQVNEVKTARNGFLSAIIDDKFYMHGIQKFFEYRDSVAELNDSEKR